MAGKKEAGMRTFAVRTAALLGAFAPLHAAPVGNTAEPQVIQEGFLIPRDSWVNFRLGYEGDFVSDGRLKQVQEGAGPVDNYSQTTNSGTVTLNFVERLDLFAVFGSSRTSAEWRFTNAQDIVHNAEMETFHDFLWAAGGRAILFQWGNCDLGCGGRYAAVNNHPSWLTIDGVNASVAGASCDWKEWQVNLDVSYHIEILTPYVGVKYSNAQTRLGTFPTEIAADGSGNNHFKNKTSVGVFVGCSFSTGKYFMLNVEGRLIDEEAVTVSGDFRF